MDDEEPILELASLTLRHFGYEVMVAKDGAEAITLFMPRHWRAAGPFPPSSWT